MSLAGPIPLDPRAFLGDEKVRLMSIEEAWAYIRLLMHQWEEGSIPSDPEEIAVILTEGRRVYTEEMISQALARLKPCFQEIASDPTRMVNRRCERERNAWVVRRDTLSAAGRKGGAKSKKQRTSAAKARLKPPHRPCFPYYYYYYY